MNTAGHLRRKLLSLTDNLKIAVKLLIAPILAILALVLVFTTSLRGVWAEEAAQREILALDTTWLKPMTDARSLASSLQANMFRITALGLMRADPARLASVARAIEQNEAGLASLLRDPPGGEDAPSIRAELLSAYGDYRRESANAVINFLKNPGWGATTARNAAAVLDNVIAHAGELRDVAIRRLHAKMDNLQLLHARIARTLGLAMGFGSIGVLLVNLFVGWRISAPLRALTEAMARLADRQYDQQIPATRQRDEVGSMARAVRVFKEGMIRADAVTAEHQATLSFLDAILANLPVAVIIKRASDLRYTMLNCAYERMFSLLSHDLVGKTDFDVLPAAEAAASASQERAAAGSGGITVHEGVIVRVPSQDGASKELVTVKTHALVGGPDGQPHLITIIQDVTERQRNEQRMAHLAQYDSLTDLPNRTLFADRLTEALTAARRDGNRVAVLGLDLDRFKSVNDTLGHAAGDMLLRTVSSRLSSLLRSGDTLARLGGDEFSIIQRSVDCPQDAEALAGRLIASIAAPFDLDGQRASIGLSVGISLSEAGVTAAELVQQADLALYDAKQAGRGCFRAYLPKLSERAHQRRSMEQDLRIARDNGELSLFYQPCVALATGAIVGSEALMRWAHPRLGAVPPSLFIPMAEETGLIESLGLWLLDEACREAASWTLPIRIAVNVSPVQFRKPGFVGHVRHALVRTGLAPSRLELEITEGVMMHDSNETLAILAELREIGIRIVLDDFGTGYASLAYLQTFTFDKIKIDRSFVMNMETDHTALAIMRAVLGLAQSLKIRTTAEGLDDENQADLVRNLGCDEAQGFLFWRPMPAMDLRALLATGGRWAGGSAPLLDAEARHGSGHGAAHPAFDGARLLSNLASRTG